MNFSYQSSQKWNTAKSLYLKEITPYTVWEVSSLFLWYEYGDPWPELNQTWPIFKVAHPS